MQSAVHRGLIVLLAALLLVACRPDQTPVLSSSTPAPEPRVIGEVVVLDPPLEGGRPLPLSPAPPTPVIRDNRTPEPLRVPPVLDESLQACYAVWRPGAEVLLGCVPLGEPPPDWYTAFMEEVVRASSP